MKYTIIVLIAMIGLISCTVDERRNQERVRLAEGYYHLGKYDQSIAQSEKVPKNSKYFSTATSWNNKAHKADEEARRLGYYETYVGSSGGSDSALRLPTGTRITTKFREVPYGEDSPFIEDLEKHCGPNKK
jgi:hypothetical protein